MAPTYHDDLPNAELEILSYLWRHGPCTARQVREGLSKQRPMAHGSTVTLLRRLEAKHKVSRQKMPGTNAFKYTAARRPEPTYRRLVRDLADRVFGGNTVRLVASLYDGKPPTRREIRQLQELLEELKRKSQ